MRFSRFGDCVVKKEDDKHVVNYQYTKLAYEEQNKEKYMRVAAARSGLANQTPVFEKKDWVVPEEPVSAWSETMTFDEMLEDYTTNGDGKEDLLLRYMVVGGCNNGRAFEMRLPFVSRKDLLDVRPVECF